MLLEKVFRMWISTILGVDKELGKRFDRFWEREKGLYIIDRDRLYIYIYDMNNQIKVSIIFLNETDHSILSPKQTRNFHK